MQSERERTLVNGFSVTCSVLFSWTPYLLLTGGQYRWMGGIKMASASTLSVNEPLFLLRIIAIYIYIYIYIS